MQRVLSKNFRHTMISNPFFLKARTATSPMTVMAKTKEPTKQASKPPNILMFSPGQDPKAVSSVLCSIENCLLTDRYILYPINFNSFCMDPWLENTELLIVWATKLFLSDAAHQQQVMLKIQQYLALGGKLLNFCPSVGTHISTYNMKVAKSEQVMLITNEMSKVLLKNVGWSECCLNTKEDTTCKILVSFSCGSENHAVVVSRKQELTCSLSLLEKLDDNKQSSLQLLKFLLYNLGIHCSSETETSKLKPADLLPCNKAILFTSTQEFRQTFFSWFDKSAASQYSVKGLSLLPVDELDITCKDELMGDKVVVAYDKQGNSVPQTIQCQFDFDCYQKHLTSKAYGHIAVYADIIGTTMTVFDGLTLRYPESSGVVAIARQQTRGQGRSGNKWLSPVGCAMFTLVVTVPMQSKLGQSLPILQHLTSVAVAHSVRCLPGLQDVNIRVKWPNDIYYGNQVKLGGVVVKSTMFKDNCIASIGCGVNISNEKPTVCVNQILKEHYNKLEVLSCEQVIARTLTILESLIYDFQQNGSQEFLEMYYKYWIHSGANVKVQRDRNSTEMLNALVIGVDDCGYLRVRLDDGSVTTLSPDGNSFDLTKNLIITKT